MDVDDTVTAMVAFSDGDLFGIQKDEESVEGT